MKKFYYISGGDNNVCSIPYENNKIKQLVRINHDLYFGSIDGIGVFLILFEVCEYIKAKADMQISQMRAMLMSIRNDFDNINNSVLKLYDGYYRVKIDSVQVTDRNEFDKMVQNYQRGGGMKGYRARLKYEVYAWWFPNEDVFIVNCHHDDISEVVDRVRMLLINPFLPM